MLWSMALHVGLDFLTHHDDAHRHLLPFSDWRFASPVSYWDPAFYGTWFAAAELLLVVAGNRWLGAQGRSPAVRRVATGLLVVTALFVAFALLVWVPLGS